MVYIALLRGINVGGKNMIKMAELKALFELLGLARIESYIQSGNILFESDQGEEALRADIESAIFEKFGLTVTVILRTGDEVEQLIKQLPFTREEIMDAEARNTEGESLYVSLHTHAPATQKIDALGIYANDGDRFRVQGRDVYLLFGRSVRNAKLANHLHKLDVPGTTRNWKTMTKLWELVQSRAKM